MHTLKCEQKINRWTVIKKTAERSHNNVLWLCRCDCGNLSKIKASALVNNKSLGCRNCSNKRSLPVGEAALNDLITTYKFRANKKKLEFSLLKKQFKEITSKNCHYCGRKPSHKMNRPHRGKLTRFNGDYIYNGIDRKDNSKGYTLDNSITCCKNCNSMKGDFLTYEEMVVAIAAVLKLRGING
jgi:hypothetical protein